MRLIVIGFAPAAYQQQPYHTGGYGGDWPPQEQQQQQPPAAGNGKGWWSGVFSSSKRRLSFYPNHKKHLYCCGKKSVKKHRFRFLIWCVRLLCSISLLGLTSWVKVWLGTDVLLHKRNSSIQTSLLITYKMENMLGRCSLQGRRSCLSIGCSLMLQFLFLMFLPLPRAQQDYFRSHVV